MILLQSSPRKGGNPEPLPIPSARPSRHVEFCAPRSGIALDRTAPTTVPPLIVEGAMLGVLALGYQEFNPPGD